MTTLPRVHVALVGVDKLVPDVKSAMRILTALPRNATASSSPTTSPGLPALWNANPPRGPRRRCTSSFSTTEDSPWPKTRSFLRLLRCIRCGGCANVCPIYKLVGGHNYGHVYIGAIGLVMTYFYHGRDNAGRSLRTASTAGPANRCVLQQLTSLD